MDLIGRDEVKAKLDQGDDFKLVMALGEWHYRAKHIPGSIFVPSVEAATDILKPEDDIVLYCSDEHCPSSKMAYLLLTRNGYSNVRRYAGGISDWEAAGYPLESEWVN